MGYNKFLRIGCNLWGGGGAIAPQPVHKITTNIFSIKGGNI